MSLVCPCQCVAFAETEVKNQNTGEQSATADVYHSANRYLLGSPNSCSICLPKSLLWLFKHNRPMVATEHLRIQGLAFSCRQLGLFSEPQLKDLAGNAFLGIMLKLQELFDSGTILAFPWGNPRRNYPSLFL